MSYHKDPQVYTAQPQSIFIKGVNIERLRNINANEDSNLTSEELQERNQLRSLFLETNLIGQDFIEEFKRIIRVDCLTGFASLMAASLEDINSNLRERKNITDFPIPKDDVCYQALVEKRQWHIANEGEVPETFGKIIHYGITEHYDNIWGGPMAVCTFFGNKVYYVRMEFSHTPGNSLEVIPKDKNGQFPGVPDLGMDLSRWNWKLHAKGRAYKIITARENGKDMDPSNDIFKDDPDGCFDMFFTDYPPQAWQGLPPQLNYCMGRCDDRFINTGDD